MRIWSIHPEYLDPTALVACWRRALLAQKVLQGLTVGYRNHPQLIRFREHPDPVAAIAVYLYGMADEADRRGYHFDRGRIARAADPTPTISVPAGQLDYERTRLLTTIAERSPELHQHVSGIAHLTPHPLFIVTPGPIAAWERVPRPDAA